MPRIAIARCSKLPDYEASVRRAGGDPWVVDRDADPAEVVARADGVLLTGGGDVDPALYGEAPHATFAAAEDGRDRFEIELVRLALAADLPVFAICRGVQVLNVARGGTLVQDIASELPGTLVHKREQPGSQPSTLAHEVWVEKDSLLGRLMGDGGGDIESCQVNSRHHQALEKLGEGLVPVATAPDGVIEAVEDPQKRFCLGVQWHPENFYRTGEFRVLFEGFVRASAANSK
jgi:putative glutamine amidotransferase